MLIFKAKTQFILLGAGRTFHFFDLKFWLSTYINCHLLCEKQNLVLSDVIKIHIEAFGDLLVELIVA